MEEEIQPPMHTCPQTSTCLHRGDTGGRRKGEKGYGGEEAEFKVRKTIVSEYTTGCSKETVICRNLRKIMDYRRYSKYFFDFFTFFAAKSSKRPRVCS